MMDPAVLDNATMLPGHALFSVYSRCNSWFYSMILANIEWYLEIVFFFFEKKIGLFKGVHFIHGSCLHARCFFAWKESVHVSDCPQDPLKKGQQLL